jgi:hypothetical protein
MTETKMKYLWSMVCLAVLIAMPIAAGAQTPDEETPAEEAVCDDETGTLKGLCNAYCEAMDCHLDEGVHASQEACDRVLANYRKKSGDVDPPCLNSGCNATAIAAANKVFFECLENADSCPDVKCKIVAQRAYGHAFRVCRHKCPILCNEAYSDCRTACIGDKDCVKECGIEFTSCTDACMEVQDNYVPECP